MAKVAISIPDDLLFSIDTYTKNNFQTRSGFISMCCTQFLQSIELQRVIGAMSDAMQRVAALAEEGQIDEAALREIEQFSQVAKVLTQTKIGNA